jgi:hypothetical protein
MGKYCVRRLEYRRLPRAELRAARANRVFCADEKRIRAENTVMVNTKRGVGAYTRSPIARGCAFHPCAIDDPRGQFFVRAILQLCNNKGAIYVATYGRLTVEEKP